MIDLSKPDLRNVAIGELVKTTKGFVWELVSRNEGFESWRDNTTKLVWTETDFKGNHHEASELFPGLLPTKEEFETAELHGIREIMDMNGKWFWSSSVYPFNTYYAYGFSGVNGGVFYFSRSSYGEAAVCVAAR
jgi:hypothetical protein